MKFISTQEEKETTDLVGGKGSHLQKLTSWGAPVPPFFVVTTDSFRYYRANKILPSEVLEQFEQFLNKYPKIALRSSMISEDHADSSFAGLFETLLDVTESNWLESLLKIFASVHSDRVQEYIARKNLNVELVMAVVAQELVEVEKSGVVFTRSPIEPTGAVAIDAAFGMGEGVVSGHAEVDHYQYTRTMDPILVRLVDKNPVLSDFEISELIKLSLAMEAKLGQPSDIEWGYKNGELYFFQIRPITRVFPELTYLVDTNLSESYPGTVSPLTAGFVKKAYENVFFESAQIMGGKGKKLEDLHSHYKKLICAVDDHLYYNLEHYYAALRALPGGEKNIENWHKMIGGKMDGLAIPYHPTETTKLESLSTLKEMISLSLRRKKTFEPFLKELEVIKHEIERTIGSHKTSTDSINYLNELINRPLKFGLTVINDVFIMMGLGILSKSLKKKGINEEAVIDLLKTSEGVDSLKPLEHFNNLVSTLSPEFISALDQEKLEIGFNPYVVPFASLKEKGFSSEVEKLQKFLDVFGDRSFEELKLESLPMKNNAILFNQLIQWASKNPSVTNLQKMNVSHLKLSWLEKKILNFTRDSIATREASRLWRGKFYHLLRQIVLSMGEKLEKEDSSWKDFHILDYFSISHEEWMKFAEGQLSKVEIQSLMLKRAAWKTKKQNYPEIIPWVETDKLPELNSVLTSGGLEGQGVSPGITEGVALVLDSPNDALISDLKNFILVTKNTDPAWVYIMSRSLGLISEKGSLLSHTAIIGRELNIPTIVGVKMATQKIKNGARIRIDATKGTIEIL
jgi:phosphoenolpyruvate synthase/pyruvate phosphate dikinase